MNWTHLAACLFAGVFMGNAIPHLVSGMMGRPFQTPFAKPPGQGLSSSTVNVVWGSFNAVACYLLAVPVGHFSWGHSSDVVAMGAGLFAIALFSARHFGRFNGGHVPRERGRRDD